MAAVPNNYPTQEELEKQKIEQDEEAEKYGKIKGYSRYLGDSEENWDEPNKRYNDPNASGLNRLNKALYAQRNPSSDPVIAELQQQHLSQYWTPNKAPFEIQEGIPKWASVMMGNVDYRNVDDSAVRDQRANLFNQRLQNDANRSYQDDALRMLQSRESMNSPQARMQAAMQRDAANNQFMQAMASGDPLVQRNAMMQSGQGMQSIAAQQQNNAISEDMAARNNFMQGNLGVGSQDISEYGAENAILGNEMSDLGSRQKYFLQQDALKQQYANMGLTDKYNRAALLQELEKDRLKQISQARDIDNQLKAEFYSGKLDSDQYKDFYKKFLSGSFSGGK